MGGDAKLSEGNINGEGQNFSEEGFVKILAGGGDPPQSSPTRGNPAYLCSLSLRYELNANQKRRRAACKVKATMLYFVSFKL